MKNKLLVILSSAALILLAALMVLGSLSKKKQYHNLLLMMPAKNQSIGLNTKKVEEFVDEEFPVTYEICQQAMAKAIHSKHLVTLVGTNSSYAAIMGYRLLDGGFFTKSAWKAGDSYAVLNEAAAFQLFGSNNLAGNTIKINDKTWIVAGVVQDYDKDNANIYVPSCIMDGQPQSLMVRTNSGGISREYAQNALKKLGVFKTNYKVVDLSAAAQTFDEHFTVAWKALCCLALFIFARLKVIWLINYFYAYKDRLKQGYIKEILVKYSKDMIKMVGIMVCLTANFALTLFLSQQILEICLGWKDLLPKGSSWASGDFETKIIWLQNYRLPGQILLAAFLVILILILILIWNDHLWDIKGIKINNNGLNTEFMEELT